MNHFPTSEQVEKIKEQYPVGTVVKLISMRDPYCPVPKGTLGEVMYIDDIGSLIMKWSNGQSLNLLPYEDRFEVILKPEELLTVKNTITGSQSEDYENKIVVIKTELLLDTHRTALNQLWTATHGPGCHADSPDGTVHLQHINDETLVCTSCRSDILGVAKDDVVELFLDEPKHTQTMEMGGIG